ncbi:MAG: hypothetical protein ACT4P9_14985 [Betaproteobacteria bacterium]
MPSPLTPALLATLRSRFRLDWQGIHGAPHWSRVRKNGLTLAEKSGPQANTRVIELFAFLHDSCRHDDGYDPMHGSRAAESLIELAEEIPNLAKEERELLAYACTRHSDGLTEAELTVQVCWDADRLDLGRVGHRPDPRRLCTPAAKDAKLIEWAYRRSL